MTKRSDKLNPTRVNAANGQRSRRLSLSRLFLRNATRFLRETPLARIELLYRLQSELLSIFHPSDVIQTSEFRIRVHSPRDLIAKPLITYGIYEEEVVPLMESLIRPGDTVVDVGANIGCHTLRMSRLVGPMGKVLAFEPDPQNLKLLRENLGKNNCTNVDVFPFALGDRNYTARLYGRLDNRGAQSLVELSVSRPFLERLTVLHPRHRFS